MNISKQYNCLLWTSVEKLLDNCSLSFLWLNKNLGANFINDELAPSLTIII